MPSLTSGVLYELLREQNGKLHGKVRQYVNVGKCYLFSLLTIFMHFSKFEPVFLPIWTNQFHLHTLSAAINSHLWLVYTGILTSQ